MASATIRTHRIFRNVLRVKTWAARGRVPKKNGVCGLCPSFRCWRTGSRGETNNNRWHVLTCTYMTLVRGLSPGRAVKPKLLHCTSSPTVRQGPTDDAPLQRIVANRMTLIVFVGRTHKRLKPRHLATAHSLVSMP